MKKLLAALIAALILGAPFSALAVTLTSDAGERLSGEDTVTFTVTATADAATATDASLRIRLSGDLTLIDGSVRIASPTSARLIGVVPGSDGFVVLMDSMTTGDTIVFEARLTGAQQSDVSCDAIQGTGESAQLSYVNAAYAPPATATSAPAAVGNATEAAAAKPADTPASGTAVAVACGAGAVIIGSVTYFVLIRKRLFEKSAADGEPADADGDEDTNDTDGVTSDTDGVTNDADGDATP